MQFKFLRIHRLAGKENFQSVFANPYKVAYKALLALYKPNQSYARLGIIIGKRYMKRAVDRNQLRRIVRESFRFQKEALKGFDIVVLVRSTVSPSQDKRQWRDDIDKLWLRLIDSSKRF
ncbi:MAG: ribonuclease P protein component [Gammaproteobacteria bacterium]|nr:ribonuclease P protein component [Gammaproteobacteria bacterium]